MTALLSRFVLQPLQAIFNDDDRSPTVFNGGLHPLSASFCVGRGHPAPSPFAALTDGNSDHSTLHNLSTCNLVSSGGSPIVETGTASCTVQSAPRQPSSQEKSNLCLNSKLDLVRKQSVELLRLRSQPMSTAVLFGSGETSSGGYVTADSGADCETTMTEGHAAIAPKATCETLAAAVHTTHTPCVTDSHGPAKQPASTQSKPSSVQHTVEVKVLSPLSCEACTIPPALVNLGERSSHPCAGSRPGPGSMLEQLKQLPQRQGSLKGILKLERYGFNKDVPVESITEAQVNSPHSACTGLPPSANGLLSVSAELMPTMRRPRWSIADYQLLKHLHEGYGSNVFAARCKLSGEKVAVKVYALSEQSDIQRMQLFREITLHSKLYHQNIIQFHAAFLEGGHVFIVQEFAVSGDVLQFMRRNPNLNERQAVNLILQPFLTALHYLHTLGIVHRDIKPENMLFNDRMQLKLGDFGLALDLNEERANTRAGTLDYMAPEVLYCPTKATPDEHKDDPDASHYTQGADSWAVGIFAYELLSGTAPFKSKTGDKVSTARNIMRGEATYPSSMSERARDFISACLSKHAGDRPTVKEMLAHPWICMFKRRTSVLMPMGLA